MVVEQTCVSIFTIVKVLKLSYFVGETLNLPNMYTVHVALSISLGVLLYFKKMYSWPRNLVTPQNKIVHGQNLLN